jgi:hypothetical protein
MSERVLKFRSTDSDISPKVGSIVIAFDSEHAVMGEVVDQGNGLDIWNHWGGGDPIEPTPLDAYDFWAKVEDA